ncbi:MAG TPA: histidine triad nucleotide-binding protein [Clostridiales bacterium]|jgi:histidine triad (HIT) family protein|nr:histidine triad nucleotide-binding protein [Clostridiales bacterium]HRT81997.1 histidine triad nucleotide-binding protein [Oscillospiraceae bacterium]
MSCIFCKIINGEIPCSKVYEDGYVFAFNDIDPKAPTHILVIPKQHISSVAEIDTQNSDYIAKIFEVISHLAKEKGMESGFRVVTNSGPDAGQTVDHLHFHLMSGREFTWPAG